MGEHSPEPPARDLGAPGDASAGPGRPRATGLAAVRWLPGVVLAAFVVAGLLAAEVTPEQIVWFAAVWLISVTVPGALLSRAILGPRTTLVADLAVGTATGITAGIVTGVGLQVLSLDHLHWLWWASVYIAWALIPGFRGRTWHRCRDRVPIGVAWALVAVSAWTLVPFAAQGRVYARGLPPESPNLYFDLLWHLSLTQEMLRPGLPQFPQVAGEPMRYHWFANQHIAALIDTTGLSTEVVMLRLWPVAVVLTAFGLITALAWQVAARTWTAPLALWLSSAAVAGGMLWPAITMAPTPFRFNSPSQLLANVVTVAAAIALIDLARGRLRGGGWAWLSIVAIAATGAKPTVLPILAAGTGMAALAATVLRRHGRAALWLTSFALAVLYLVGSTMVAGSTVGNVVGLSVLRLSDQYRAATGDRTLIGTNDGFWLESLSSPGAPAAASAVLLWLAIQHLPRLLGLALPVLRTPRRDPAAWWLIGATVAGWGAYLLVDHNGASQVFYQETLAPLASVATAWLAAAGVDAAETRTAYPSRAVAPGTAAPLGSAPAQRTTAGRWGSGRRTAVVLAAAAGAAVARIAIVTDAAVPGAQQGPINRLVYPAAVGAIAGAAAWLLAILLWKSVLHLPPVGAAALAVAVAVGASVPGEIQHIARVANILSGATPLTKSPAVSQGEQEAALWVRSHVPSEDVLASNVHCQPPAFQSHCDTRAFWVAGLSGRRVLIEGWAYFAVTFEKHGLGGRREENQPSSWPNRLLLSQQAIADPTPERMQLLRDAGVRWIFAVRRASPVSPALSTYADLVHSTGDVDVYRIRGYVARAPGPGDLPDGGPAPASTPAGTPPAPVVPAVR